MFTSHEKGGFFNIPFSMKEVGELLWKEMMSGEKHIFSIFCSSSPAGSEQ